MDEVVEYPFVSRYLERHGQKLHYIDEGVGEPVVMVHGNPTWSFYFRRLISALRPHYRCIAMDHIGCGKSDKPPLGEYPYRLINRVQDLEALLDDLGIQEKATFVLHDWGGMIGGAVAQRRPERVGRFVLMNTASFGLPAGKKLPRTLAWARNSAFGRWMIVHGNAFSRAAVRWCVVRRPLSVDVRNAYLAPYRTPADRIAVLRFVEDIPLTSLDPSYDLVQQTAARLSLFTDTPTFIGWGGKDFVFDDDFLAEWHRRLPNAEVHRFDDAGHFVLEDAGDELIPMIEDFLKRRPAEVRSEQSS